MVVFIALYLVTNRGTSLLLVQCLYAVLYLVNLAVVVRIYGKVRQQNTSVLTC